jgi:hypothetical protein
MDSNSGNTDFTIEVTIKGSSRQVRVNPAESTDGVEFYKCQWGEKEIAELRKDVGEWRQIWGDLNEEEVKNMGAVIDAYIEIDKIIS